MPKELTEEQRARRARTAAALAAQGMRFNPHLPATETEAEARFRTPEEVADRLLALTAVAIRGEGEDALAAELIRDRGVAGLFSPTERRFVDDTDPGPRARSTFTWRYEAAWVLFWALGWLGEDEALSWPDQECEVPFLAEIVQSAGGLADAGLKPSAELLDACDLVYCQHWAVRQARLDGAPMDGALPNIVSERHHALNWLVGYADEAEWDDVPLDT